MIVGIDLGTTHSLIGVYEANGPRLLPNAHGELLTPSVVSLIDGAIVVGQPARDRLVSHPGHSVATFKRWMGSERSTRLGDRDFRPEELAALVLRSLLADAEAALGSKVEEAVISVPAYFSDAQRKATRIAAELAGIRVERLINEPTAAALAYGLQQRDGEGQVLVLDLGGGTFDVSILDFYDGVVEVRASAGDNYLGGEDFSRVLFEAWQAAHGIAVDTLPANEQAQILRRLEVFKCELGNRGKAVMQITVGGAERHWEMDETAFADLCAPLLQRMRVPIERAIRDARLQLDALDDIVLVGGAMRMPMVTRLVTRMFGRLPLRHVHPDHAIALGAAVAAGLKARDQSLREVVLTDVCPYTLGVNVSRVQPDGSQRGGYFKPIIQRNSVVPVSRESWFHASSVEQPSICLQVYQGENPLVERNIALGELDMPLHPALNGEQRNICVRFTYDVNGLLQVEATEAATGARHELVLQQNPGLMSEREIAERLQALQELKVHPREAQQNIAVIARLDRMYEEHIDQRDVLIEWREQFQYVLESQDTQRINEQRRRLSGLLDALEQHA